MSVFLKDIGMENYEGMLVDNGVDSFEILAGMGIVM